ncbi:gluconate 2-dehydrogenase subunit 3 family protein [Sinomicrobium soli]|uniref:gluconate 2-dehydrogenase subunit 3 family protein n=1 Tax=Sinomicrobium sp. N-1-3-6 TaxID=2219864 RepID=UPI000DCB045B|nr:gluconate 2-dehydrogenase subunit 3 family protein [Sinomicrobium sp. N-1-3-6]RAV27975.1 gluconate 2-dehydrogenase subunit 3 family protein [Sinomicrobium sp. N-1-3-6]
MQRRDALKNIGLSLGLVAATPTLFSILQSCTADPKATWTPEFFSPEEGDVLSKMVDIIIPPTEDLPGAGELNVPQFIDKYVNEVYSPEDQKMMRDGMKAFAEKLGAETPGDLLKASPEEIEKVIASALQADEKQRKEWDRMLREYRDTDDGAAPENRDALVSGFVKEVRGKTIQGYKISEYIGEEVMAYDPIPGAQKGCISLEEATGGKLWSL